MTGIPKPFDCEYSPQFAELLNKLGISLVISTYQAGKVIILSASDEDKLIQLPRTFDNPMGMAVKKNALAVATKNEVIVLRNAKGLAENYPEKPGVYDGIYVPRAKYYTGYVAMHDMEFLDDDKIIGVNTLFSCLAYVNNKYSFTPFWKPPFISKLVSEDRCHLNGIAVENNKIKFITALGKTDSSQGWREHKTNGGIVMEYPSGKIITDKLAMPHSPRVYDGKLYLLNSAQGELIHIDPETGEKEVICNVGGFARGMSRYGDYLFIGVSKLRHNSEVFRDLPIAETSFAGVVAVYLPYGSIAGSIKYKMSVDEIYDVKVLEGLKRPSILSDSAEIHKLALSIPGQTMWAQLSENKKSEKSRIKKEETYNYKLVKISSQKDFITQFSDLIFEPFLKKIQKGIHGKLIPIIALYKNIPVALAITEIRPDKTAELHSVFTKEEFRKKGLAENLLKQTDKILIRNNIKYTDVVYSDMYENYKITENLIKKIGFLQPKRTVQNIKLNIDNVMKADWIKDFVKEEQDIKIFDFSELSETDKEELSALEKQNKFPLHLRPFQMPDYINPKISKIAKYKNKIAGWCILHNVNKETLQCSALFVFNEHRDKLISKKLMAKAFSDMKNIKFTTYQIEYKDKFVLNFLNNLFAENNAIENTFHTIASRKYYEIKNNGFIN
ncbi:MAG: TIGR03032 family protein [Bacteroidetes bacterium]|nr:MAG: TIGR03032 family protein [Bacteroidota bacterium]